MGTPKALLEYRGETFLARIERILAGVCDPLVVVLGHETALPVRHGRVVVNPDPERGMLSSLQCGLAALTPLPEATLFIPVDYPAIEASTVQGVADLFRFHPDAAIVMPRDNGKRGHPVLMSRRVAQEILALPVTGAARDVIRSHNDEVLYWDVADPGIHTDIDTPEDYRLLKDGVRE
jgi:CTP:molybdopterin cytidylyltransferase MocA